MLLRHYIQPPFWSRIPALGLRTYPEGSSAKFMFWISAIVYSIVYFYLIALAVVIFTHSLWIWSSFQNYVTTTLFDIVQKNLWLVIAFVLVESFVIYRSATAIKEDSVQTQYRVTLRTLVKPLVALLVIYIALKLFTRDFVIEPNFAPVMTGFYLLFLVITFVVDKYIPRT